MPQGSNRSLKVSVCALACAAAVAISLCPPGADVRTEDQNGDGRPDTWRLYDRQGQLSEMTVDTNFDGRSDVHEYYQRGALVRRESDRDFNDRVDLVREFDASTGEHASSVIDVDSDGRADLLVIFQGGQPVFSKWAHLPVPASLGADEPLHHSASSRPARGQLAPLADSFGGDLAVKAVRVLARSDDCVGLSTSGGLPASGTVIASPFAVSSDASAFSSSDLPSAAVPQYSPRGPPASHLLG